MQYTQAKEIAIRILKKLEPFCYKIDIVGSIAKEENEIKSIQMFCLPRKPHGNTRFSDFQIELHKLGFQISGNIHSNYIAYLLIDGDIHLEIFMPNEYTYYLKMISHETTQNFKDKIQSLVEEKGMPTNCETEWEFFNKLGLQWVEVKNRI